MSLPWLRVTGIESAVGVPAQSESPLVSMPREAFAAFHESTARSLRGYLFRITRSDSLADEMTQEAYLRLLRSDIEAAAEYALRRNYLFKIATNLARDHFRQRWHIESALETEPSSGLDEAGRFERTQDVQRTLASLTERERALLWLAYVEKLSHREIGAILDIKEASVRPMLLRARRRFESVYNPAAESAQTGAEEGVAR